MKGIYSLFAIVLVAVALALIAVPGLGQSVISSLTGTHQSCYIAPYDKGCVCAGDTVKEGYSWSVLSKYRCTPTDIVIDPNAPDFRDGAIAYAKALLMKDCPSCDLSCAGGEIDEAAGVLESGEETVAVECLVVDEYDALGRPVSAYIPWRIEFSAWTGYLDPITGGYCTMPDKQACHATGPTW